MLQAIVAQSVAWESLQGEGDGDGVVGAAVAQVSDSEGQGRGPVSQIAVNGVVLLLHAPGGEFVVMGHAPAPVLIKPVVKAALEKAVPGVRPKGRVIADVKMPQRDAPHIVWSYSQAVIGITQKPVLEVGARFGTEREP